MKKILFIGCSNGVGMHHAFRQVFQLTQSEAKTVKVNEFNDTPDEIVTDEYCEYTNLSNPGSGNTYIRHRLFEYLEDQIPDYVYLQFSGLNRRDLCLNHDGKDVVDDLIGERGGMKITNKNVYVAGNVNMPNNNFFSKHFFSIMYSINSVNSNNYISLQEIFTCLSILEKLEIKHNWTFYYDPQNAPTDQSKLEGTLQTYPKFLNLHNKLPSPLNFAIEKGSIVDDGIHYPYDIFLEFLRANKDNIHLNLE